MPVKYWKTVVGRCVFQDNFTKVHQNALYRWLTFDSDALQTLIHLRKLETPGLQYIRHLTWAARLNPADCCLLGLGGAGVAHTLSPFLKTATIKAVEHSNEVISIAKTFFMADKIPQLLITKADAFQFVQECNQQYQHLLIDLFNAHTYPEHCRNYDFFYHCKRLLSPGGILAINLANITDQWSIFQCVREQFGNCTVSLPVKGTANLVLLACNSRSITPLLALLRTHKNLKKLVWDGTWGYIAAI